MAKIESDVNQERQLAKTLIELREVYTRAKLLLPAVSLPELLTLAGAMEQAKTEGMKLRPEPAPGPAAARPSFRRSKEEPKGPKDIDVKVFNNSPMMKIGKGNVHVVVAIARLLASGQPMTIPEMLSKIDEKGWKLGSKSEHKYQVLRGQIDRHPKYFKVSRAGDGTVRYSLKTLPAEKKAAGKKSSVRVRKDTNSALRSEVVKALISVDGPITAADLAEKVGRSSGQGLVPLLVSMKDNGALKKTTKTVEGQDVTTWTPNVEKLRVYEAERTNGFTKEHVAVLNGVSHA